jgi:hypothetical protein
VSATDATAPPATTTSPGSTVPERPTVAGAPRAAAAPHGDEPTPATGIARALEALRDGLRLLLTGSGAMLLVRKRRAFD